MDQIIPNLYLGNLTDATNEELLKKYKITHVLSIIDKKVQKHPFITEYKQIVIQDIPIADLSEYFEETSDFLEKNLNGQNNILVHCRMGISRSSSVILAYLMRNHGMTYKEAYLLVKSERPIIKPNSGFVKQLKSLETKLKDAK